MISTMEELQYRAAKKNIRNLFFGTLLIVLFFIIAVKFNIILTYRMVGEKLPEIVSSEWLNRSDVPVVRNRATVVFFWRPSIEISNKIFQWALEWDEKYRRYGLRIIAIVPPFKDKPMDIEAIKGNVRVSRAKFEVAFDHSGLNRKNFISMSYAFLYIADGYGIIREIENANDGKEAVEEIIVERLVAE